jgi:cytochrome c551
MTLSLKHRMAFSFWLLAFGFSCSQKDPKFQQYFVEGEQLYLKNCSNCHHKDGKGLGLVYPPLAPSDFMENNFGEVICLIRKGRKGEMTVNGSSFNQPMPGIPSLTELEIAEIATYIYNSWGHQKGLIEVKQVNELLNTCPSN